MRTGVCNNKASHTFQLLVRNRLVEMSIALAVLKVNSILTDLTSRSQTSLQGLPVRGHKLTVLVIRILRI